MKLSTLRIECLIFGAGSHHHCATIPGKAVKFNGFTKNREELFKLLTLLIVTQDVLLSKLQTDGYCSDYIEHF